MKTKGKKGAPMMAPTKAELPPFLGDPYASLRHSIHSRGEQPFAFADVERRRLLLRLGQPLVTQLELIGLFYQLFKPADSTETRETQQREMLGERAQLNKLLAALRNLGHQAKSRMGGAEVETMQKRAEERTTILLWAIPQAFPKAPPKKYALLNLKRRVRDALQNCLTIGAEERETLAGEVIAAIRGDGAKTSRDPYRSLRRRK